MLKLAAIPVEDGQLRTRKLDFSLARSRSDLAQAFRLVFQSYYQAGLVDEKPSGVRLTPHHLLPTSEVLLAKLDELVVSTVSVFGDGYLGLPMQSMYPNEVKELRQRGWKLAEIGCLADRRDSPFRFIETFAQLGRLLAQVAKARGIDAIVVATHPKHARLYKRVMGFEQMGELTQCPYVKGKPAVALHLRFDDHIGTPLYDQYFGDPFPESELAPYRWDRDTRRYFRQLLERDSQDASIPGIRGYFNWAAISGVLTPPAETPGH